MGQRDTVQIEKYCKFCSDKLQFIFFPEELSACFDVHCEDVQDRKIINSMYNDFINVMLDAAVHRHKMGNQIVG